MITIALAALYIIPCVIFLFFVKNDMLEKPDKSKENAKNKQRKRQKIQKAIDYVNV